ncbi:MAG: hypothetical protein GX638_01675 [Crenarchaeota archaeon]|nr:hypothetical protein [Thermoproteota archaeon]
MATVGMMLFIAFILRLVFFSEKGYQIDTNDFLSWMNTAATCGIRDFYNVTWCDYPPLNIYLFWGFGSIINNLSLQGTDLAIYIMKLGPNLFDLATAFIIFVFARKHVSFKLAILASILYAFNPAVIFNVAIWGQFDAIYTFFLILSLYLILDSKPHWAMAFFILGILTKPQSIALAPIFLYMILQKNSWKIKSIIFSLLVAAIVVILVILPFNWSNPIEFITSKYFGAYATYPYTTLNAFNIWAIGGMWVSDLQGIGLLTPYIIGWVMFALVAVFTIYFVYKKSPKNDAIILFAAFVLFFAFFMLPTRIHERYLFPALAILALLFPLMKKARPLYVALTATCFINQAYVLSALVNSYPYGADLSGQPIVIIVSLINSVVFVYVLMLMYCELTGKKQKLKFPSVSFSKNLSKEVTKNENP